MKAVLIRDGKCDEAEGLYIGEYDKPAPADDEVLVRVKAFGLNRMDILQRKGQYPLPPYASSKQAKEVLGVEFSGVVEAAGKAAGGEWKADDEVFGLVYGGAMAEYVAVKQAMLVRKPAELSWAQAAAIPEQWMTAYQALRWVGRFERGQNFLMHAGGSGVGVAAIQLARHLGARHVFATAGSDEKTAFLRRLGCTDAINYKTQDFQKIIADSGESVDVIVDPVGQSYFAGNIASLARDGRLVYLGFMSGSKVAEVNLAPILFKRLRIEGTTLRSRAPDYQGRLLRELVDVALPQFVAGKDDGGFDLVIHSTHKAADIVKATLEMEGAANTGKIVCEW